MPAKLTVTNLKQYYMYGIPDTDPATGEPFPDTSYQYHIDNAYRILETLLDLSILPATIVDERQDYYAEDYAQWGFIRTYKRPVQSIEAIVGKYPYYQDALVIPPEWIVFDQKMGHINIMPVSGTFSQFILTMSGSLLPNLFRFQSYVPRFWSINYTVGFQDGEIPEDLTDAAGKLACISVMNVLGDLIGGVGVLGASIGLDGLSQFLSMTKTATTSAFYARVLQYRNELFGSGVPNATNGIFMLKRKYRGIRMTNL